MHFSKTSDCPLSVSPEILAFGNYCSANFQPILDCFIPNFKLMYEDLGNIKTDRVNTVIFNLHQVKRRTFFLGHPVEMQFNGLTYNGKHLQSLFTDVCGHYCIFYIYNRFVVMLR